MDVIRLAVSVYEAGILDSRDGTHIGMKAMTPLRIDQASPPLGTPDHMEIHTEEFPCHTLSKSKQAPPGNPTLPESGSLSRVQRAHRFRPDFRQPA